MGTFVASNAGLTQQIVSTKYNADNASTAAQKAAYQVDLNLYLSQAAENAKKDLTSQAVDSIDPPTFANILATEQKKFPAKGVPKEVDVTAMTADLRGITF